MTGTQRAKSSRASSGPALPTAVGGAAVLLAALLLSIDPLAAMTSTPNTNANANATAAQDDPAPLKYPAARKTNVVDDYHGVKVPDPYRWLEDPDSDETRAWVEAQNAVTYPYLESIPAREPLKKRLTEVWNYERYGTPFKEAGRYFISRNDGLQNQSVLYVAESLDAEPRVLIDPNALSADGTVALSGAAVSHGGKYLAYGVARSGSDWNEWRVRDVDTGADLEDHLDWIKFSGASWSKDDAGFCYTRYPEPDPRNRLEQVNYHAKLHYHRLGTPQADDPVLFENLVEKEWRPGGVFTDDGAYLVITISKGTDDRYKVFYKDLAKGLESPAVELVGNFDHDYSFIDNDGPIFWFRTDKDAPRGRVVAIDVRKPDEAHWVEVIPQTDETLRGVFVVGDRFVVNYLKDARSLVRVHALDGTLVREVALPGIGSVGGFGGKRSDPETFYSFTNFATPAEIHRYDVVTGEDSVYKRPEVAFDPDDYETRQVFYAGKDGTRVPMFITHRKGLVLDGSNPVHLYGYGGFNISLTPAFSPVNLVWMEMGGVHAVPNLRGGGEYGEPWHKAGTKDKKQNVFDDFIAAAEYLIAEKYTRPDKLAIAGGSNGGLLVGACMTQRPELFGAALPAVGVMDMLRFHKFTIGWAWCDDYGSSDNPEDFPYLYAYSPLHNIKPGVAYPATLITTADHDDRVVPAHSFKFAATLQAAHVGPNPVLIRIETKAGHGAGKPTAKLIEEAADKWAFLTRVLKMDVAF